MLRVLQKLEPERCGGICRKPSINSRSLMRLYSFKNSCIKLLLFIEAFLEDASTSFGLELSQYSERSPPHNV